MSTRSSDKIYAQSVALLGDAMVFGMTGAVERMEQDEQRKAVNSQNLPKPDDTRAAWEALGFTFGEAVDDLFVKATMPAGWSVKPTDHAMWNNIVDDKGNKRGQYFYKGAFYDRNAHMGHPLRRYTVQRTYRDTPDGPPDYDRYQAVVMDGETEIHRTEAKRVDPAKAKDWEHCEALERSVMAEALAWLTERFPDHANPAAYR